MAKFKEKYNAQKLRKQGKSIREIAKKLNVSKGSVSYWCRDIVLNDKQIEKLVKNKKLGAAKGRLIASETKRKKRLKQELVLKKKGINEIGQLSKRDIFLAGVGMYWSEGYTYSCGDQVGFTNADPKMILLMLQWFKKICKVSKDRFSLAVRVNRIHEKRIDKIEQYWSNLTGIPRAQFNKTILINSKSKKIYSNLKKYYGTLRITIRKGTRLRRKINGWIAGLSKGLNK